MKNYKLIRILWPSSVIIIFFIVDRMLKNLFYNNPSDIYGDFFGGLIGFSLQLNKGISYNIPLANWIIILITTFIIFVLIFYIIKIIKNNELEFFGPLLFIIIGALSNFIDRIRYSYVIDMINISHWLTFNIADVVILIGAIWLVIIYLKNNHLTIGKKVDSLK